MHVVKTMIASSTTEDMYNIELTAIELEHIRWALKFVSDSLSNDSEQRKFATKNATIINESLVSNGD